MKLQKVILTLTLISALFASFSGKAQMVVGTDTLYGNEWINYDQSYYKIKITEDGIYRITHADLVDIGFLSGSNPPLGKQLNLIRLGKDIPIFMTTAGVFSDGDFFEFYGKKNRGETDAFLYRNSEHQLNPEYSLFSDTAVYYLTWNQNPDNSRISGIPNDLNSPPGKEDFCFYENKTEFHNGHFLGKSEGSEPSDVSAEFGLGEGFCNSVFGTNQSYNLSIPKRITGQEAIIDVRLQSSQGSHILALDFNNTNYVLDSFSDWAVKNYRFMVSSDELMTSNNKLQITGRASSGDKFRVSNISFKFPHPFDFEDKNFFKFELPGTGQSQYLEIENFNSGGTAPVLYDLTTNTRILTVLENSIVKAVLPGFSGNRRLILSSIGAIKSANGISTTDFTNFSNLSGDYIILSNSRLFDDGTGKNYVQEYADYRSSQQGGNYSSVVVDVNQVYDQFGYGIDRHEQSIRNFIHWAIPRWNPKLLFIIGKGVYYRTIRNAPDDWEKYDFVPSFGYPSSDNLLAASHSSNVPKIPVGRIAAYEPDMIRLYLEKVKELENVQQNAPQTIKDRAWMKNILHLGGGGLNIQTLIQNELENLEQIAVESTFGANVFSLFKNSTDAVQATSEDVIDFINSGVSLITFFGHSAPSTLDFDIGDPNQYQNEGKYPFIYAMGCNTNRLFETRETLSEQYVFVENKGAVTFIGSTATTSLNNLAVYGKEFYKKLGNELYGATIGDIMRAVILDYPGSGFWKELVQNNIMLHGDPALKINPHLTPDFLVDLEKTQTEPALINAHSDSFKLDLTITNIGYAITDSIDVAIHHELPTGDRQIIDTFSIPTPGYELNQQINIPLQGENSLGKNKLRISLDVNEQINETPFSAENNNEADIPFVVISNSAFPVYPSEFSIVSDLNDLELKASAANAFSEPVKYYFEIDTSANFDSPISESSIVESEGGLMKWKPSLVPENNTVYFWRVSIDSTETAGTGFNWAESSFLFFEESEKGWNQSSFEQYIVKNNMTLELKTDQKEFSLGLNNKEIKVQTGAFPNLNYTEASCFIDGFREFTFWPCPGGPDEMILMAVLDSSALTFKTNPRNADREHPNCWEADLHWFIFGINNVSERQKLIDTIRSIKKSNYVALFTTQREPRGYFADEWASDSITLGTNIFQILEEQGATKVRNLADKQTPYIFIFQKGNPNWEGKREVHSLDMKEVIQATTFLTGRRSLGSLTSSPIGPSQSWSFLSWNMIDLESHDYAAIDVFGITKDGKDSLLQTNIQAYDTSLMHIDANEFPYLKLRLNLIDSINYTAPQLDYWRVFYEPYPELALNPSEQFEFHADTLQEGDKMKIELAIENAGEIHGDSLLVKFSVKDKTNNEQSQLKRFAAMPAGSSLIVNFETDTRGLAGKNLLTLEANPNNDQPEQLHFNNIGVLEFFVEADQRNPLLDVTFDGERIMNGDIVSPTPEILIELKDENRFLALEDTSSFEIGILYPNQLEFAGISVSSPEIEFVPANSTDLENNRAKIYYRPQFLEDGIYKLRVNAKDASGNKSGDNAFEVAFEIVTKSMISNMVNYPNPFSNATRFVYTLTGNEVPADFKIQIMTVTGRIVREVTQAEFGFMKVGTHLSDFVWDGRDEFGDLLANGVYLYRVVAKNAAGENIERYDSKVDQYFNKNYGKMMLIR